jgi:hypothetical protein
MARYPHLVDVAWDVVEQLVKDWKANPHFWEREIDVQSELRSRLAMAYTLMGRGEVIGVKANAGSAERVTYRFSRVACEPSLSVDGKNGQTSLVRPDVVVWGDPVDPMQHMGDDDNSWPILWACEIKYLDPNPTGLDLEKLQSLIKSERIAYGCWLTLNFDRNAGQEAPVWVQRSEGASLWICNARARDQ